MSQITNKVIMFRPANFGFNAETAENNFFQTKITSVSDRDISRQAVEEFDRFVELLRENLIEVLVIEDTKIPVKPDAVFPNNWISTHGNGAIITYPMNAKIRRLERREDVVDTISATTENSRRYGFEYFEKKEQFLEGTGSMILDRGNKIIYACLSVRTDMEVLDKFSVLCEYTKVLFTSTDGNGDKIYHTNVMMSVGEGFAVVCLDSIKDEDEKKNLLRSFSNTNKEVIDISMEQVNAFAGNMLQLKNSIGKRFIIMSLQAKESLTTDQIGILESHGMILSPDIKTIETIGGGSARCMIAENFLG